MVEGLAAFIEGDVALIREQHRQSVVAVYHVAVASEVCGLGSGHLSRKVALGERIEREEEQDEKDRVLFVHGWECFGKNVFSE